jgi:hypothetical protein
MRMTTKLVWPVTLLASFALAAACGGGSSDADGTGGEGGEDGSGGSDTVASGGSTGGQNLGGGAGEGGLGGGGPVIIVPLTCSDGEQNEAETDVDCGGPDCDPCEDDAVCVEPIDCDSGVCTDGVCIAPTCGDRVTNGEEDCDPGRETDDCNVDCTFTFCGDGYVNERVEECEQDPDLGIWQRCGRTCIIGVDLDGTWRTSDLPGTNSPWEMLEGSGSEFRWLPTFHYREEASIIELFELKRFDLKANEWHPLLMDPAPPSRSGYCNSAPDGESQWIVLGATMYQFDVSTELWTPHTESLPDVNPLSGSGVVHDGDGNLWYVGYDGTLASYALVKFDSASGSYESFPWTVTYVAYETRLVYDPIGNKILFGSYDDESTFLVFDLDAEEFTITSPIPDGGYITDATCQDRAGGMYLLSSESDSTYYVNYAYRYDIATDAYEPLPTLPFAHDYNSSCVVSETGYLYYGAYGSFARLRLNTH